ncbi:hypothetical protein K7432_000715 [Basidiobolus ranarum]|uniref:Uncharacterized protein n=1 Tax=Basidiobolus ranarum TaxID=34480 RepID=A0ABR2X461_9FUNG
MSKLYLGENPYNARTNFELEFLVTSHFVSPKALILIRGIGLVYSLLVFALNLVIHRSNLISFLCQFPTLSYIGSILYFSLSVYYSIIYNLAEDYYLFQSYVSRNPAIRHIIWILYATVAVYQSLLPPMCWAMWINNGVVFNDSMDMWIQLSLNGVNFFFICLEMILSRWRLQIIHLLAVLVIIPLNFLLTWVVFLIIGKNRPTLLDVYPNNMLPTSDKHIWATVLVSLVITMVTFMVIYIAHKLRDMIGETVTSKSLKRRSDLELIEEGSHSEITAPPASGLQYFMFT